MKVDRIYNASFGSCLTSLRLRKNRIKTKASSPEPISPGVAPRLRRDLCRGWSMAACSKLSGLNLTGGRGPDRHVGSLSLGQGRQNSHRHG